MGLVHTQRDDYAGGCGECGDGVDRGGNGDQVSEDAGEERTSSTKSKTCIVQATFAGLFPLTRT